MDKEEKMLFKLDYLTCFCALTAVFVYPATGGAQAFPTKNISLIVPFPAGGGTDLFARAIGTQLTAQYGRQVIIDNRTGASGNIGAEAVVRAAADGHTLLYTASTLALSRAVYSKLNFDAERDLRAITMTVSIPQVLVVHPSLPARDVRQLVALSKQKSGDLTYSSGGGGSAGHFAMELFRLRTGASMLHIPYRGAAPALTALISGEVQLAFLVPPLVQNHLANGKLRALGVSSHKRSAVMPEVPTLEEQGVRDFQALQWHGFFAPAKTPDTIIDELFKGISSALQSTEVKKRLAAQGAELAGSSAQEFAAFFKSELVKWGEVAQRAKMRVN
jgi:tripartite-type tricarboxylate transporter receptor subunit TctC